MQTTSFFTSDSNYFLLGWIAPIWRYARGVGGGCSVPLNLWKPSLARWLTRTYRVWSTLELAQSFAGRIVCGRSYLHVARVGALTIQICSEIRPDLFWSVHLQGDETIFSGKRVAFRRTCLKMARSVLMPVGAIIVFRLRRTCSVYPLGSRVETFFVRLFAFRDFFRFVWSVYVGRNLVTTATGGKGTKCYRFHRKTINEY